MVDSEEFLAWVERTKAMIAQVDVEENGPIPDDPRESYMRGIEAGMILMPVLVLSGK